jgi:4-aminobutyrate aminotransferase
MGALLMGGLRPLQERLGVVGDVRGKGLMVGVELVRPGTLEPSSEAARLVLEGTKARGLLIGRGGLYANTLRIAPPLSVSRQEVVAAVEILVDVLQEVNKEMEGN